MIAETKEKEQAVKLRKQGKTYNQILEAVDVSKSTLSLWLRAVGLSKPQKQNINKRRKEAQMRGAQARRRMRIEQTQQIYEDAVKDVVVLSKRERLFIGVSLYWAEGSKEKFDKPGQGIDFGNTDGSMIKFFIDWLLEFMNVELSDIVLSLYIHKNHEHRVAEVTRYWEDQIGIENITFAYIYFKKHNPKTLRKNTGKAYHGTLRLRVKKSASLQRRISGMIYGITGAPYRIV